MKTFAFRLEAALRWRNTSLDTEKARLEPIRALLESARSERERLRVDLLRARQKACQGPVSGADLQALDSYANWVDREIILMGGKILAHEEAVEKQRQVVTGCDRNVRLLERLRARRKVEWQEEHERELSALLDDYSAATWLRERKDAGRSAIFIAAEDLQEKR